jgi:ligand-binding sensor domain-containing protein
MHSTILHFRLLLIGLFVAVLPGFAQRTKQYSFRQFTVSNGLASNWVSSIMQDRQGYIWMGTLNGLQRYDGSSFITIPVKKGDPKSLPGIHIRYMFRDRKDRLWMFGEGNRVGLFDTRLFTYEPYGFHSVSGSIIRKLIELPDGGLLLMQEGGKLYRLDEAAKAFRPDEKTIPYPKNWRVGDLTWDPKSRHYYIGSDSGIFQYNPANGRLNYHNHNPDNDPLINKMAHIRPVYTSLNDGKGNLFFTGWPSTSGAPWIYTYHSDTQSTDSLSFGNQLGYHELAGFLRQKNNRLWAYGKSFIGEWPENQKLIYPIRSQYRDEQTINFDNVTQVIEDRENNIWVATDNGVFYFNPDAQIFNTYNLVRDNQPPSDASVQALEEMSNGNLLVGTWGSGLFCYDRSFNPVPLPKGLTKNYKYLSVWDMTTHPKTRDLWITLQAGKLIVYDQKNDRERELEPEIFMHSTIRQVDEDTSGNLWFGTQNGRLIKWDYIKSGGDPSKGYELVLTTNQILKVHFDYQGFIYVATNGKGLLKVDAKTNRLVKSFTTNGKEGERLFMDAPGDMTYFNDTTLIVSARCLNIINTKTDKVRFLSMEDGLPSNTTESIQKDYKGTLWLGMTNGLCRINLEKNLISYYDRRDGISWDKFSMAGVKELSDGRLVFFTDHNFLAFEPLNFGQNNIPAKPFLTSVKVAGINLSMDSLLRLKRMSLKYNNTAIAINFSSLSFVQQRKLHFYYMLENLDKEWIHTDRPIEVTYNYLPPGDYVFKVKSENADGITSEETVALPILVRAPVWKAWWFYGLIILLFVSILYFIDRERINKRKSLLQIRRQIAYRLHDEISDTLGNITVLSEIAKIKADKNIEQSKEFIDQISDKSRYMNETLEDMLWSIDPQNDSMKQTLLRLKEYTDGLKGRS